MNAAMCRPAGSFAQARSRSSLAMGTVTVTVFGGEGKFSLNDRVNPSMDPASVRETSA